VDARNGVVEQSKRHSFIANLLRIQHLIVAVNKMDLVEFDKARFDQIVEDFKSFASRLDNVVEITFIPMSALDGDNVVDKSENMPWYEGPTFLYHLENVYVGTTENHVDARFPVQWVIRPHSKEYHDFRGFAGRIAGGVFKPGDEVICYPSGFSSRVKVIYDSKNNPVEEAYSPMSVVMTLENEIDISRGGMITKVNSPPKISQDIEAVICWFSETKLDPRGKYVLRHAASEGKAVIREVKYKIDVNSLHKVDTDRDVTLNEIARIRIRSSIPLHHDPYRSNRITGSFILVHAGTNETVAAGMIV